jgi:uncharacterized protein
MTTTDERILPRTTPISAPYWEGCRQGELRLQGCLDCGGIQHPPRVHCSRCRGSRLHWQAVSGRGRVESFTWVHMPLSEAWAAEAPYALVLVRLAEGPLMMSNLREASAGELAIGLEVEVFFEPRGDGMMLPQFRPLPEARPPTEIHR